MLILISIYLIICLLHALMFKHITGLILLQLLFSASDWNTWFSFCLFKASLLKAQSALIGQLDHSVVIGQPLPLCFGNVNTRALCGFVRGRDKLAFGVCFANVEHYDVT